MRQSSGQQYPPPDEESHRESERPLTPALLLWRLWRFLRDRPRLFQRVDGAQDAGTPPSLGQIALRLLPVWFLLLVILVLAPGLPGRAFSGTVQLLRDLTGGGEAEAEEDPKSTPAWDLQVSPVFTPQVQFWADDIAIWSLTYQIHPNLIATVMQIESCGDPTVSSPAGASGLFQVTGIHFQPGEEHLDPQTNARAGLTFFAYLMELSGGDVAGSLAGYNAGEWAVDANPAFWPDETQRYVYWGTGIYAEAQGGLEESPRLNEWIGAGGVHLCNRAAQQLGIEWTPPPTPSPEGAEGG